MKNSDEPNSAAPRSRCKPVTVGLKRKQRRARQHRRRHDQREHQEADPCDLDRGQCRRQIFRRYVGGSEKYRRCEDQRDALERTVGARGCFGRVPRPWLRRISSRAMVMERCPALRLRRGAGSRQSRKATIIESGEALKNAIWTGTTRSGKRDTDMRDCARRPAAAGAASLSQHFVKNCVPQDAPLQHRQTTRLRSARKRLVECGDLALAEFQFSRGRIVRGVFRARGFWNRKHRW